MQSYPAVQLLRQVSIASRPLMVIVLLVIVQAAWAQPCIRCKDCQTNNCFSVCKQDCPPSNAPPNSPTVSGTDCQASGRVAGATSAQSACQSTLEYCKTRTAALAAKTADFQVSLPQCQNIAYGVCQQTATDPQQSPCGYGLTGGYQECSKDDFTSFYNGEVDDFCRQNVQNIG